MADDRPDLHLVDLVAFFAAIFLAIALMFVPGDRFAGEILDRGPHVLIAAGVACGGAFAFRYAVRQRRPAWHLPLAFFAFFPLAYGFVRVVNAIADRADGATHTTKVVAWHSESHGPSRGHPQGTESLAVLVDDWRTKGAVLTIAVPSGALEREARFRHVMHERHPEMNDLGELSFPVGGAIEIETKPGALGLEHVVRMRLLIPDAR